MFRNKAARIYAQRKEPRTSEERWKLNKRGAYWALSQGQKEGKILNESNNFITHIGDNEEVSYSLENRQS